MKLDVERLRSDLTEYCELAGRVGLPLPSSDSSLIPSADEERLIDMAADLGWDFGKYVTEY